MNRDVKDILHSLEKSFGKGVIKTADQLKKVKVKPTGLPMLDVQLGGGWRMRGINVIAGKPQSGKTSVCMQFCAECQKDGFFVLWVDLERQFDIERAVEVFGMNPELLWVMSSDRNNELLAEQLQRRVSDTIRAFNSSKDNRLIVVVDSLAANVSEKDVNEDDVTKIMGGDARINNQTIKIWNSLVDHNQCIVLINEFRDKIGEYGNPDYLPGGWAQYYFASTIVHTRQGSSKDVIEDDNKVKIGERFNWTVKKSRNAPPRETGGIAFYYDKGFDITDSLIQYCLDKEIIRKSSRGGYFELPNGETIQGKDSLIQYLEDNKDVYDDLWNKLYSQMPRELYVYEEEENEA